VSRQFRAYASAYQSRGHESELRKGEVQQYACDFNGALNGESIASAAWSSDQACVSLSGLSVSGGVATVTVTAVEAGCAVLTLQAVTSAGRRVDQEFTVDVAPVCAAQQSVTWTAP
jgi:hypothetical protein